VETTNAFLTLSSNGHESRKKDDLAVVLSVERTIVILAQRRQHPARKNEPSLILPRIQKKTSRARGHVKMDQPFLLRRRSDRRNFPDLFAPDLVKFWIALPPSEPHGAPYNFYRFYASSVPAIRKP
jgi:hypothetical protein